MCLGVPADRAGRAHGHPAFCVVGSQRTPVPEGGLRESLSRAARPQLPLCLAPTLGRPRGQRCPRVTRRFSCSCTLSSVSFAVRSFYLWCHLAGRFLLCRLSFDVTPKDLLPRPAPEAPAPPSFSPPTVSGLTAKPLIRVDVLFACGVREGSGFTLLHVGVFPVCTGETRRFQQSCPWTGERGRHRGGSHLCV